jgi:MFS family permease
VSDSATLSPAPPLYGVHLRRNFALGVLNGAMFSFAEALMSVDTVLTWFVQRLGGSNFLIGLVGPMRDAGWFLPQLFVSHRLQREPLKMPLYRRMMAVRAIAWSVWTLATVVLVANFPALLAVFFIAYGVNALASGFAGLSFMDIVAKTIPATRRGSFFGGRLFLGGVLGLLASALVGVMVAEHNPTPFPTNVAILFVLAWVAALIGLFSFALVKEPDGEVRAEDDTLRSHVRRAARLPRHNQNLRFFLIARVVNLLSYIAAPFYSIYSIDVLHAPVSILGVYVGVRTIVALLINPVWARLSDRRGNKLVMQLSTICGVVMLAWVLFAPIVAESVRADAGVIAYLFVPVFALMGSYETGVNIGSVNLLLEIAPGNDRAIHVGLANTVMGLAYFSTIASGLLVDALGYRGVFAIALVLLSVAVWALSRLQEPRDLALPGTALSDELPEQVEDERG